MPTIQKWVRQEFMHFTCASSKRVENFMRWKSSKCFYACNSRIYAHNLLYLSTKEIHLHANRSCWSTVKVRARESTGTFYTNIKIHFVCSLCVQKLIQRESLALDIPGFYLLFPRFFFPVFYYASFLFIFGIASTLLKLKWCDIHWSCMENCVVVSVYMPRFTTYLWLHRISSSQQCIWIWTKQSKMKNAKSRVKWKQFTHVVSFCIEFSRTNFQSQHFQTYILHGNNSSSSSILNFPARFVFWHHFFTLSVRAAWLSTGFSHLFFII